MPLYGGVDAGARTAVRGAVVEALAGGVAGHVVFDHVARGLDAVGAAALEAAGDGAAPACRRGCAFCCHTRVEATALEIFALARVVRSLPDAAREDVARRVAATRGRLDGLSSREHHLRQVPCALLTSEGVCVAYDARPLACRRAHSTDAAICEAVHREPTLEVKIPDAPALTWNASSYVVGYFEGLAHAGRAPHQYELHAALSIALEDPSAESAMLAGEDRLEPARTRSAADLAGLLGRP